MENKMNTSRVKINTLNTKTNQYGEELPEDQRDLIVNRETLLKAMQRGMHLMFKNGTLPHDIVPRVALKHNYHRVH